MREVCGRFAPTPSGPLHVGSARTALAAWLDARSRGGRFVLRGEDLDTARERPGALASQLDDLRWLGLDWDEGPDVGGPRGPYLQSACGERYRAALEALRARGLAYPCACSRREVEEAASAPHGAEPVYPGTCRELDEGAALARCAARGRRPAWRLRVGAVARGAVSVVDAVAGVYTQDVPSTVGDFVLLRADGVAAYQLAVVVDDAAQGVTDVVRGDDLLASAPRQVLLQRALGLAEVARYAHVPLVLGDDGARLAKRHGATGLGALRERGVRAEALRAALLASLGQAFTELAPSRWRVERVPREPVRWGALRAALGPEARDA